MKVDKDLIRKAIEGDRDALASAFYWHESPQGNDYWNRQHVGETPIDVDTLKGFLGEG